MLNELCVPIQGAFANGTSFASSYWSVSARWTQVLAYAATAVALGCLPAGIAAQLSSEPP